MSSTDTNISTKKETDTTGRTRMDNKDREMGN